MLQVSMIIINDQVLFLSPTVIRQIVRQWCRDERQNSEKLSPRANAIIDLQFLLCLLVAYSLPSILGSAKMIEVMVSATLWLIYFLMVAFGVVVGAIQNLHSLGIQIIRYFLKLSLFLCSFGAIGFGRLLYPEFILHLVLDGTLVIQYFELGRSFDFYGLIWVSLIDGQQSIVSTYFFYYFAFFFFYSSHSLIIYKIDPQYNLSFFQSLEKRLR